MITSAGQTGKGKAMNDPFYGGYLDKSPPSIPVLAGPMLAAGQMLMAGAGGGGTGGGDTGGDMPSGGGGNDPDDPGDRDKTQSLLTVFNSLSTDEQEEILLALSQMLGERKELRGLMAAYAAQGTSTEPSAETRKGGDDDPED